MLRITKDTKVSELLFPLLKDALQNKTCNYYETFISNVSQCICQSLECLQLYAFGILLTDTRKSDTEDGTIVYGRLCNYDTNERDTILSVKVHKVENSTDADTSSFEITPVTDLTLEQLQSYVQTNRRYRNCLTYDKVEVLNTYYTLDALQNL